MIKAVIFDCFGVLTTTALEHFVQDYLVDNPTKLQKSRELMGLGDSGSISAKTLYQSLAGLAGTTADTVRSYHQRSAVNMQLINYISEDLKPSYKLSILSNAAGSFVENIIGPENIKLFDDIVLSYRVQMVKPDPQIYQLSAKNLGVREEECVFIDDKLSHCDGAKAVGMRTVLYKDFEQMKSELDKILASSGANN